MALVACPECGKKVSDSAVMCPGCGFAVRDYFQDKSKAKNIAWVCSRCGQVEFEKGECKYCKLSLQKNKYFRPRIF